MEKCVFAKFDIEMTDCSMPPNRFRGRWFYMVFCSLPLSTKANAVYLSRYSGFVEMFLELELQRLLCT